MPPLDVVDPVVAPSSHDRARASFHAALPPALSHGYRFYDALVDHLYAGGRDEDAERFGHKIRRKPKAADEREVA